MSITAACVQTEGLSAEEMHVMQPPFDCLLTSEHVPG